MGFGAVAFNGFGMHPFDCGVQAAGGGGVAQRFPHRHIGIRVFYIFADYGDRHGVIGGVHLRYQLAPVLQVAVAVQPHRL